MKMTNNFLWDGGGNFGELASQHGWDKSDKSCAISIYVSIHSISRSYLIYPDYPDYGQVQRKAESEQSFVRPEIEERLQKAKLEVHRFWWWFELCTMSIIMNKCYNTAVWFGWRAKSGQSAEVRHIYFLKFEYHMISHFISHQLQCFNHPNWCKFLVHQRHGGLECFLQAQWKKTKNDIKWPCDQGIVDFSTYFLASHDSFWKRLNDPFKWGLIFGLWMARLSNRKGWMSNSSQIGWNCRISGKQWRRTYEKLGVSFEARRGKPSFFGSGIPVVWKTKGLQKLLLPRCFEMFWDCFEDCYFEKAF